MIMTREAKTFPFPWAQQLEIKGIDFDFLRWERPVTPLMLKLEESNSYKIVYSGFGRSRKKDRMGLILLVGAGRFERPTPCAQDIGARKDPHL
jgi:hypothetical protein